MTERIITDDDIDAVSTRIRDEVKIRLIDAQKGLHHKTLVLFAAYSGQRPSTIGRLTVGQFRQALSLEYPVLKVEAHQDKIRMAHYVPIHPSLIKDLNELINERADEEKMFNTLVMERWLKERNIPLSKANNCSKFVLSDCRKFFEQKSDEIGFDDANKAFIMTHGVSGVQWSNYKAFLPENVYSRYMEYWGKSEI